MHPEAWTAPAVIAAVKRAVARAGWRYGVRLSAEDIEDLAQDTLVRLVSRETPEAVSATSYASRVAHNVTVDALRRSSAARRDKRKTVPLEDGLPVATEPAKHDEQLMHRQQLAEAIAAWRRVLTRKRFRAVCLRWLLGLSSLETAELLGTTASAVDSLVHRARLRLSACGLTAPQDSNR